MSYWGGTAIGAVDKGGSSQNTTHQIYSNASGEYALGIRSDATVGRGVFIRAGSNDNYESLLVTSYDENNKRFAIMGGGTVIFGEDGSGNLGVDSGTRYQFNGGKVFVTGSKDGDYITEIRNEDADNGYGLRVSAGDDNNVIALAVADKDQSTKVVVTGAGNVGIGTNVPDRLLHVEGNGGGQAVAVFEDTAANANILIKATVADKNSILNFGDAGSTEIGQIDYDHADNSMRFVTNASEAVRIESGGNVGIGTNNPGAKLDIKGDTDTWAGMAKIFLTDTSSNSNRRNWSIGNGGSGYGHLSFVRSNAADGVPADSTGTVDMCISEAGNVGIGTVSPAYNLEIYGTFYSAGSSREYKEDISDLEIDSSLIYNLRPVSYNLKDEFKHLGYDLGGDKQLGLISEEVNDIIPELAIIKDGKPKNVDYEKLSILLLKEVQNLRVEIDNLKKVQ